MKSAADNTRDLFARRPAERIGLMDNIWSDTLQKWLTQGYPSRRRRKKVKERVRQEGRWVEKSGQRRRRYYRLTSEGRKVLASQRQGWRAFVEAINRIAGAENA